MNNYFEFTTPSGDKFNIGKRLGKGAFGEVQIATNTVSKRRHAIKHEHLAGVDVNTASEDEVATQVSVSQLKNEFEVQSRLQNNIHKKYIYDTSSTNLISTNHTEPEADPQEKVYDMSKNSDYQDSIFGHSGTECQLITNLYFKNLAELYELCGNKFSKETICQIGLSLIDSLEQLHSTCYVHKDLKPENMMINFNFNDDKQIYLIDFGLSCKYKTNNGTHVPFKNKQFMTGTARQSSINAMKGQEHSRRDDLESLGYIILYLAIGKLPWQGLKIEGKRDRIIRTLMFKEKVSIDYIAKDVPSFISNMIKIARNMLFEDDINQDQFRNLIKQDLKEMGIVTPTQEQDWIQILNERSSLIERFEDLTLQDMEKIDILKKNFYINKTINNKYQQKYCCNNKGDRLCKGCKVN